MKEYIKRFLIWFIIILLLIIVYGIVYFANKGKDTGFERTNTQCLTQERVFDYADKLSDEEEAGLRDLIAEREEQIGCDIILVTLNEPVDSLMAYADDFYDNNKFGYDEPWGDGVIYVDNWYTGDTWLSTSGRVEDRYSSAMINSLIQNVCEITNQDPYEAYKRYVNGIYRGMNSALGGRQIPAIAIFLIACVITAGYLIFNLSSRRGKKTTTASTYVEGGKPTIHIMEDQFLTKHVTSRHIETSSSGGGGGSHMSSGGHSHGGGGGHH